MLTYRVFIGGHVYAVDFVVCDVALNPLNLSAHLSQNSARLLRYCLELLRRKPALFWNFCFDNELRHGNTSCLSFSGEEFEYLISASVIFTTIHNSPKMGPPSECSVWFHFDIHAHSRMAWAPGHRHNKPSCPSNRGMEIWKKLRVSPHSHPPAKATYKCPSTKDRSGHGNASHRSIDLRRSRGCSSPRTRLAGYRARPRRGARRMKGC